jgi:hypothetical protein
MNINDIPSLVEPGVKYFLNESLKQCHQFKQNYKNQLFNLYLFLAFCMLIAVFLIYKYKGKLTPEELEEKELQKKYYILSRIKNFQDAKIRSQQALITGLPHYDDE